MSEGNVPRGVTVGGVDIGDMSYSQAEARLRNELAPGTRESVEVTAGDMSTSIDPMTSGLAVDWAGTIEQAGQQPMNPITRVMSFFQEREVGIVSTFDDGQLDTTLERVEGDLTRDPENATLAIDEQGAADIGDDVPGQTVDTDEVRVAVKDHWLNADRSVSIDAEVTEADVLRDAADAAVTEYVDKVTDGDVVFTGRDDTDGVITPGDMGKIVTFEPEDGALEPEWNTEAAQEILSEHLGSTEVEFRNASFEADGRDLKVIPSQDGVLINWEDTLDPIEDKLMETGERTNEVAYDERDATYTTEMAERASFDDVVGSFSSGGFASDSGVNIRRTAELVDGAIVLPGETFSLNGHTGPRGEAQGFVDAGIIQDGRADRAVGGGISQFATTLYNASYFAGMEDVAHTPHSYYIDRYPAGREATVFEGAIDLQFKNTYDTPVLIEASADSSEVTVRLRGVKHVEVESDSGPRTNYTDPQRREVSGDDCSPSSGGRGFTITDTRTIKDLDGGVVSRETTTTVYDPQPIITCSD
ncbi:MAG: VanW family protein [Corynebacterium sp.]|uniref:VanW family protein n=1 Tax=Corynebacterium TaxID=1716 RepID=UPI002649B983|nr:VanW family protein [Corynebacterium sp.]MDN5723832.1 VanW family protein [Corynebacterium sp.]MDN6283957.1 VanW family protein [Corynebacterium sp.]MDN6304560.1 VanW family protein [Corynebacterium sp.]MDN6353618.1 VanW family protein [Corynebacterium sp.]MDN6366285.1 VanW family protein [Corynebacterium sp.]